MNTDAIRTTLGLLVTQTLNVLVLLKIITLEVEALGAINLLAGTLITFAFFFFKSSTPPNQLS